MAECITAVVPAGGQGVRMDSSVPKQFLTFGGIPLLVHALQTFESSPIISEIILVVPESDCDHCRNKIVPSHSIKKVKQVVAGGRKRRDSVLNGLQAASSSTEIFVVHDAVRPFLTESMIDEVVEAARKYGAAIVAIPTRDTVKRVDSKGFINETVSRDDLWLAQTPQAFQRDLLLRAHQQGQVDGCFDATDDAFLVERLGLSVAVVQGNSDNIKLTRPEDFQMAQAILAAKRMESCR